MKTGNIVQMDLSVTFHINGYEITIVFESRDRIDIHVNGTNEIGLDNIDDALDYVKKNYRIDDEDVEVLDKMLTTMISKANDFYSPKHETSEFSNDVTAEELIRIARDDSEPVGVDYMRQNVRNLVTTLVEELKDSVVEDITTSIDRGAVMETVREMCKERIMSRQGEICREVEHQVAEQIVDLISADFDCELENLITDEVLVEVATNIIKEA